MRVVAPDLRDRQGLRRDVRVTTGALLLLLCCCAAVVLLQCCCSCGLELLQLLKASAPWGGSRSSTYISCTAAVRGVQGALALCMHSGLCLTRSRIAVRCSRASQAAGPRPGGLAADLRHAGRRPPPMEGHL